MLNIEALTDFVLSGLFYALMTSDVDLKLLDIYKQYKI